MARIDLNAISKAFGTTPVLRQVELAVEDGEFVVLVGPSGCGKSTLLRILAGLEEVDQGDVLIDGRRANDLPPARRGIAMVFQSYALYPHMSVRDNMAFGLRLAGKSRAEVDEKVAAAAGLLEIEPLLDRRPKMLSGGQRQRVAIGRAIVREPSVFLFDEPLSNLDAELRVRMRYEFARLHQRLKTTTVYVTHDQVEAMTLADRIAILDRGEVVQFGSAEELYEQPATLFVAGFIGSPKMNFVPVTIDTVGAGTVTITGKDMSPITVPAETSGLKSGDIVTMGIRPHALTGSQSGAIVGQVRLVERLGNETIVSLQLPSGAEWLVVLDGDHQLKIGNSLALDFAPGSAIIFDQTGLARHPEG